MAKGFAPVPSLPLFLDFCAAKVVGRLPAGLRRPQREAVLCIEPLEGAEGPGGWGRVGMLPQRYSSGRVGGFACYGQH